MLSFIKKLLICLVAVPIGLAAFFAFMFWPSVVFGYEHVIQGAWFVVVAAMTVAVHWHFGETK